MEDLRLKNIIAISEAKTTKGRNSDFVYSDVLVRTKNPDTNEEWFGSIEQAVDYLTEALKTKEKKTKIPPSTLAKCAAGYYPKVERFVWQFLNIEDRNKYNIFYSEEARNKFLDSNEINRKELVMFNLKGQPLKIFDNVYSAMEWLRDENKKYDDRSHDYKAILNVCKEKGAKASTAAGYQWRYLEDVQNS